MPLTGSGGLLTIRRPPPHTGWAGSLLAQIEDCDTHEPGALDGVTLRTSTLSVDIEAVLNAVIASRAAAQLAAQPETWPLEEAA